MKLEIWIGFEQKSGSDPRDWAIMVMAPGAEEGACFRGTYDSTTQPPHRLLIESRQSTSPDFGGYRHAGHIEEESVDALGFSACKASLRRAGQDWVVAVLEDLEGEGLLLSENTSPWRDQVEELRSMDTGRCGASGTAEPSSQ